MSNQATKASKTNGSAKLPDTATVSETMTVGPDLAREFLSVNHPRNRKANQRNIERYVRDMKAGRWAPGGQLRFSAPDRETGICYLIDGANRMRAVNMSGTTQEFVVTRGCPPDTIKHLDNGGRRTAYQNLRMAGEKAQHAHLAVVNMLNGLNAAGETSYRPALSTDEYAERIDSLRPAIDEVYDILVGGAPKSGRMPASVCAAAVLGHLVNPVKILIFLERLASGENLKKGDPAYALREHVLGVTERHGEVARTSLFLKSCGAIMAYLHGRQLKKAVCNAEAARTLLAQSGWVERWMTGPGAASSTAGAFILSDDIRGDLQKALKNRESGNGR